MRCVSLAVLSPKLNVICLFDIVEDNNQVGGSKKYCPFCQDIGFYEFYTWKLNVFAKIRILQKSVRILWFSNQKSVLFQKFIQKSVQVWIFLQNAYFYRKVRTCWWNCLFLVKLKMFSVHLAFCLPSFLLPLICRKVILCIHRCSFNLHTSILINRSLLVNRD